MSSRCSKCGLSDDMERTDEVADQSACRESDQSVNQESAKGVKDYFEPQPLKEFFLLPVIF